MKHGIGFSYNNQLDLNLGFWLTWKVFHHLGADWESLRPVSYPAASCNPGCRRFQWFLEQKTHQWIQIHHQLVTPHFGLAKEKILGMNLVIRWWWWLWLGLVWCWIREFIFGSWQYYHKDQFNATGISIIAFVMMMMVMAIDDDDYDARTQWNVSVIIMKMRFKYKHDRDDFLIQLLHNNRSRSISKHSSPTKCYYL